MQSGLEILIIERGSRQYGNPQPTGPRDTRNVWMTLPCKPSRLELAKSHREHSHTPCVKEKVLAGCDGDADEPVPGRHSFIQGFEIDAPGHATEGNQHKYTYVHMYIDIYIYTYVYKHINI